MKKKISLLVFALATSTGAFAQDARSAVNQILDKYAMPIFLGFMLIGIVTGLVQQWDNIIDKDNRGTRKDGLFALAWYVGYALIAAIVVSAVTTAISGISLQV
jgi:hypothetical protein